MFAIQIFKPPPKSTDYKVWFKTLFPYIKIWYSYFAVPFSQMDFINRFRTLSQCSLSSPLLLKAHWRYSGIFKIVWKFNPAWLSWGIIHVNQTLNRKRSYSEEDAGAKIKGNGQWEHRKRSRLFDKIKDWGRRKRGRKGRTEKKQI